jgi:dTDP-4-dehydrorhamnose 3,5-epimerase
VRAPGTSGELSVSTKRVTFGFSQSGERGEGIRSTLGSALPIIVWRGTETHVRACQTNCDSMIFTETMLAGAFMIDLDRKEDNRGFFARAFCQHEFLDHGLNPVIAQANIAFNSTCGTVRGMHFQFPPAAETKLVRCTRGAILDLIVDLRPESATYLRHVAVELSADNGRALYVPERFAHGYQVLEDRTETSYQVGEFYTPGVEGGLRYDDPGLGLDWPLPVTEISEKDLSWAPLADVVDVIKERMTP